MSNDRKARLWEEMGIQADEQAAILAEWQKQYPGIASHVVHDSITCVLPPRSSEEEEKGAFAFKQAYGELKLLASKVSIELPETTKGLASGQVHGFEMSYAREQTVTGRMDAWVPPFHNLPLPSTGSHELHVVMSKVRRRSKLLGDPGDANAEPFLFLGDFLWLERRLLEQVARASWTLQDCHWRDGEE